MESFCDFVDVREAWFETLNTNNPNTWSATEGSKEMRDEMNDTKSTEHSVPSTIKKTAATKKASAQQPAKKRKVKSTKQNPVAACAGSDGQHTTCMEARAFAAAQVDQPRDEFVPQSCGFDYHEASSRRFRAISRNASKVQAAEILAVLVEASTRRDKTRVHYDRYSLCPNPVFLPCR
jgi:hypothetical protein